MTRLIKTTSSLLLSIVLLVAPNLAFAALTVGATSITTDSTLSLQGGNVGIGTTPAQLLEVGSTAAANTQLTIRNTNAGDYDAQIGFQIVDGTNSYSMGIDDSDSDRFKIATTALGGTDLVSIESSSGDLGIGVANPVGQLHVSDSTSVTEVYITNSVTGVTANDGLLVQMANSDAYIFNQEAAGDLIIGTASGIVKILNTGLVGIGTSDDPTEALDINSNSIRIRTAQTPVAAAACSVGDIAWDTSYIYVCTASGAWKRATLNAY